jgi:hypothetical protein
MNCQSNAHGQREIEAVISLLSQTAVLLDETRAFSFALTMALARTPRENLSAEEIDGLCQLAYELLAKLTKTSEVFQEARQTLDVYMKKGFAAVLDAAIMI